MKASKSIRDLEIVGDKAHIKIAEIGTNTIISEFDFPIHSFKINDVVEDYSNRRINEISKSRTN